VSLFINNTNINTPMTNNLPRIFTIFILLSIVLLAFKCEKDDDYVPVSNNVGIVISDSLYSDRKFQPTDTLSNIVNIAIDTKKKNQVARIDFYIDGKLVAQDNSEPFVFTWNTLKEDDGQHQFKAILIDKKGNSRDLASALVTNNTLMKVKITGNLTNDIHFILSDDQGKRIHVEKFNTALEKNIKASEPFYGDKLNLTYARINTNYGLISSSINLKKGSLWQYNESEPSTYKKLVVYVKGSPGISEAIILTTVEGNRVKAPELNSALEFSMVDNTNLYIEVARDGKLYYDFIKITESPMEVDLATVTKPISSVTIPTIAGAVSSNFGFGIQKNNGREDYYYLSGLPAISTPGSITFNYPPTGFDYYSTYTSASVGNKYYDYSTLGPVPSKFVTIGADATVLNKSFSGFSGTFTGILDKYVLIFSASIDNVQYNWAVDALPSQGEFILPEIGDIIGTPSLTQKAFNLNQIRLIDDLNFSDKSGYLRSMQASPSTEVATVTISLDNSSQRKVSTPIYLNEFQKFRRLPTIK
jgi:hypothetical protein